MPTVVMSDGSITVTTVSTDSIHIHHPAYLAFIAALEDVDSLMSVDTFTVLPFGGDKEFHYILTLMDGRVLNQDIKQKSPWEIRPNNSSYFKLTELLANNVLRSSIEVLVDELKVTSITVTTP